MADTTYISKVTTIITAWLQAVNNFIYRGVDPKYVVSTGAANAYTITLPGTSLLAALTAGSMFTFKANFGNTGPATLTVVGSASLGPYAIQQAGVALTGGEIGNNAVVTALFDGTAFQLIGFGIALPIPLALGGTGAVTAAVARANLVAANLAGNSAQDFAAKDLALTGTSVSTKACAAGYTRVGPNYCQRNSPLYLTTSTNGGGYQNVTPADVLTDAKALYLSVELGIQTANVGGVKRYTLVVFYSGAGGTGITTRSRAEFYENVAIPATDISVANVALITKCAVNGAFSVISTGIPVAAGTSTIYLLGYFD